ncbi:MAG TPA: hypothetical protein PKW11_09535, partial [Pseudomonadota bacterium]|nr:hypothetical protein [Pseudomonadota bacterium]
MVFDGRIVEKIAVVQPIMDIELANFAPVGAIFPEASQAVFRAYPQLALAVFQNGLDSVVRQAVLAVKYPEFAIGEQIDTRSTAHPQSPAAVQVQTVYFIVGNARCIGWFVSILLDKMERGIFFVIMQVEQAIATRADPQARFP